MPLKIGILISGNGSNLQAIIDAIEAGDLQGQIDLVVSNKKDAYGLERAKNHGLNHKYMDFSVAGAFDLLAKDMGQVDLIVLAGFLVIIPGSFVKAFSGKIINLHPSLLPKHGGPGMYGHFVHEAVLASGDKLSGASIHYVDEGVDSGQIIVQDMVNTYTKDSPDTLAKRISFLEHELIVKGIKRWKIENSFN